MRRSHLRSTEAHPPTAASPLNCKRIARSHHPHSGVLQPSGEPEGSRPFARRTRRLGLALQLPFCLEGRTPSDRFVSSAPEFFFVNDTASTEIYTLSLRDALPSSSSSAKRGAGRAPPSWSTPT